MQRKSVFGALVAATLLTFGAASHAATSLSPRGDLDRDGIQNRYDKDRDGDGIANARDPNPNVPNRRVASNGRYGDRDGDGVLNYRDHHPNNPRRS